jgi:LSU ribosomal protein L30P
MKQLRLTLVKSPFGQLPVHRECARGLGLRRIGNSAEVVATPEVMGMVRKIEYMLKVEEL